MNISLCKGIDKDTGNWVTGKLLSSDIIVPDGQFFDYIRYNDKKIITEGTFLEFFIVYPETVCVDTTFIDEKYERLYTGDIVEYNDGFYYFKAIVTLEVGAFGIATSDTIPLELADSCHNDNFVSFWELVNNGDDPEAARDHYLYNIKKIGNIHDDFLEKIKVINEEKEN